MPEPSAALGSDETLHLDGCTLPGDHLGPCDEDVATSYVGERANPHPSQGEKYVVEVIDQVEGEVCVRYVSLTNSPWWITEEAWRWWKAHTT